MRILSASLIAFSLAAATYAQPVVVVAPPPPVNPELTISDPYGPCLPNLNPANAGACIPNPYYRPNFTVGVLNYGAPYAPAAPPVVPGAPAVAAPRQLSPLELEAARLAAEREREQAVNMWGTQVREQAMDQLRAALKTQQTLQAQYRAAWPVWSAHWSQVAPTILKASDALRAEAGAGRVERGCGAFLGFLGDLRVALPPAPDYALVELHQAMYSTREACMAAAKDAAAVGAGAAAVREAVRIASEWAEGRGAYYASTAAP